MCALRLSSAPSVISVKGSMASGGENIQVEVVYALPREQKLLRLEVPSGTTAYEAVKLSGIAGHFPGLDIEAADMGVFGKIIKPREYVMNAGERVEIYRPLKADPKDVRKQRAAQAKEKKA